MTAIPPSPTPVAPGKPARKRWAAYFGLNSMAVSILLHVLFGVGATYLVVEHFQKKHINFHAAEPPAQHSETEHKVELAKRNSVDSAPPDLKRIVTTDVSAITLPEPPEVATTDEASPSAMAGVDGIMGMGMGSGGTGGNGGGGNPLFGTPSGDGLVGDFYDMKQTADRQPNSIANNQYEQDHPDGMYPHWETLPSTRDELQVLRHYVVNFDDNILQDYFHAPITLFAPQICIPALSAAEAPKAFGVEKLVQPRRWIVVYKARIVPPVTGDFRFIGFGDDYMVVRINDQNVLDACWPKGLLDPGADVNEDVGPGPPYSGLPLACGTWIHMSAGLAMDMKVLIGEGPGGGSAFFLFIQQKGVDYPKGDYPVFQLEDVPVPLTSDSRSLPASLSNRRGVPPNFTGKKMIFGVQND